MPRSRENIPIIEPVILNLAVALGIGLLIGAERERRKGEGPSRSPAGIRTFTVTSLAGAISFIVGGEVLLAVATAGVIILTAAAYWRGHEDDPGLTTEIALILTALLGGLSVQQPALAAGLAVIIAILLAARSRFHRFLHSVLQDSRTLLARTATPVRFPAWHRIRSIIPRSCMASYHPRRRECLRLKGSAAEILSLRKATLSALALRVYMVLQLLLKFARVRSIMEYLDGHPI